MTERSFQGTVTLSNNAVEIFSNLSQVGVTLDNGSLFIGMTAKVNGKTITIVNIGINSSDRQGASLVISGAKQTELIKNQVITFSPSKITGKQKFL